MFLLDRVKCTCKSLLGSKGLNAPEMYITNLLPMQNSRRQTICVKKHRSPFATF